MERIPEKTGVDEEINIERVISSLMNDRDFVDIHEKVRQAHLEQLESFIQNIGDLKDEKFSGKTFFQVKGRYIDHLLKNGFVKKAADNLNQIIGKSDLGFEKRIEGGLKGAKRVCKTGELTASFLIFMGKEGDKSTISSLLRFKPETILLYKTGNLTIGRFFELQPWTLMDPDSIKSR